MSEISSYLLDRNGDIGEPMSETERKAHHASNQRVLLVTCISFAVFVAAEIIGALAGNSLALLGDAAAMSVDVFTYFSNMYAESIKAKGEAVSPRTKFILDVCIPSFSVCALLGVTAYITSESVQVLINNGEGEDDVNILFLYLFASANFVVDIISSYMFYAKRNTVFLTNHFSARAISTDGGNNILNLTDDEGTSKLIHSAQNNQNPNQPKKAGVNLNMLSAFTHVGGDTMRTSAVFIAAVIATVTNVSGNICDAWASVVVTITIIGCVIPLVYEIYKEMMNVGYSPINDNDLV
eukprot:gene8241-11155_t